MCWMCDQDKSALIAEWSAAQAFTGSVHYQKESTFGFYDTAAETAFPGPDGVGDKYYPTTGAVDPIAAVIDQQSADTGTTGALVIGGPRVVSTINTPGDEDWYKVTLTEGVTYDFGVYMTTNGPSGIPLADAFVEIYDSQGRLITWKDGGGPNTASGLDSLISFTATYSGTFYVNARAFDEAPIPNNNGDFVGDYEVFARVSNYDPYYYIRHTVDNPATTANEGGKPTLDSSPLHAIDWGTQFDGTSRNPDGAEGPRVTGNEVENKIGGKNVLYVYFARQGEVFVDNAANPLNLTTTMVAKGLEPWERQAFENVFAEYEKVADLDYIVTDDRWAADIVVITYDGTPGPGLSLLGRMSPPDTASEGQTEYNAGDERWTQQDLAPGGFYFSTLIHEFGHGHGMAHPHDEGGQSSVMRGVTKESEANYTRGEFDLNQGVFTMMSYEDGWETSPYGQPRTFVTTPAGTVSLIDTKSGYGWIGSLMALDIAVIQDKYGVNEEWATGNNTYTLKDENVAAQFDEQGRVTREATSYKSIWDAGGIDEIVYNGNRDANIDLRPATLKYEVGGGGWVSYAWGIHGGYTIANSVTIENARSGAGKDTLIGNDANNVLNGGAGADTMTGGKGNDLYYVDNASDKVVENPNEGTDTVATTVDYTLAANVENLQANDIMGNAALRLSGNSGANTIYGTQGNNVLNGGAGADFMVGYAGDDFYDVDNVGDVAYEEANGGTDTVSTSVNFTLGANLENLQAANIAGSDALNLTGNGQNNNIYGTQGSNVLNGAGGADLMVGYAGNDLYYVDNAVDLAYEETGGGTDTVATTVSFTLSANVENLQANDIGGTAALSLYGNELGNWIWGTQGNNVLAGRGGIDHLYGYAGADQFLFDTAPTASNYDYLGDFQAGVDKILLDDSVFSALAPGALSAGAFVTGPAAQDADDRIIFNNGALYYDADGNGAGAAVLFAYVSSSQALTAADFTVV